MTFFKAGTMMLYPGDVMETDAVIDFLTNEEALELPDKIEAVDDENLFRFQQFFLFYILMTIKLQGSRGGGVRCGFILRRKEERQHEGSPTFGVD